MRIDIWTKQEGGENEPGDKRRKDAWVNISILKALLDKLLKSALQHDYEAQASHPKDFVISVGFA